MKEMTFSNTDSILEFFTSGTFKGFDRNTNREGGFFCGDLLENIDEQAPGSIIDDPADFNASIEKLESLKINTIYPSHGKPFLMAMLTKSRR
ncbi:hypothetical protein ACSAZL_04970 [Methanosarcina sp. T3]|uniref:hypothetical protein n=1 Tax=Methanosarcina sp. T3 TaxID=3439062 RepID=UPI003F87519B